MERTTERLNGDLWIPRTNWEKRRQLSAVIHRSMATGRKALILSCDNWTTFFGRIDITAEDSTNALAEGKLEYARVAPLNGPFESGTSTDLSRVLGEIGLKLRDRQMDLVIVDDVDLLLDFQSEDTVMASLYALLYALRARFEEIVLFTNPLKVERDLRALAKAHEVLTVHRTAA